MSTTTRTGSALELFSADPRGYGRRLRRVLWSDDTLRMLPDDGQAYGWNDGGCLVLADALVSLFAPVAEIVPIMRYGSEYGDHYVTRVGAWHLDGAGAQLGPTLLRRWEREELYGRCLAYWSRMDRVVIHPGTDRDAELSARVAAHVARTVFGVEVSA